MKLKLEKLVDGTWYEWGRYSIDDKYDMISFSEACNTLSKNFEIRVELVKE